MACPNLQHPAGVVIIRETYAQAALIGLGRDLFDVPHHALQLVDLAKTANLHLAGMIC